MRTEPPGILITTTLRMLTFPFFHVAQDKHLQCMWKQNVIEKIWATQQVLKYARVSPAFHYFSFIWKDFICSVSLSWLFSLVQLILDIHCFFLRSLLSSELIVPYRYQVKAASSGRKEYLKWFIAGSQESGLDAYVALQIEYVWIQLVMWKDIHKTRQFRSANPCDLKSLLS